jgi:hypothetical protein
MDFIESKERIDALKIAVNSFLNMFLSIACAAKFLEWTNGIGYISLWNRLLESPNGYGRLN